MKPIKKAYWLLSLFLCVIITAKGQTYNEQADSVMALEQFGKAALMYEYAAWKAPNAHARNLAQLGKAQALKEQGKYEEAGNLLQQIPLATAQTDLQIKVVYEQVLNEYLQKDYKTALSKGLFGQSVFRDTINSPEYHQYLLLLSLSGYQDDQWDLGYAYALRYLQLAAPGQPDIISRFNEIALDNQPRLKSEKLAKWLSILLPGTGQMYAGNWVDGITSLVLHAAGLGGAVWAFMGGYYISAWLGAALIVQRVYLGGIEHALELVQKRNRLKKNEFLQPIYQYLLSVI